MRLRARRALGLALAPAALAVTLAGLPGAPGSSRDPGNRARARPSTATLPVTVGHRLFLVGATDPAGAYRRPDGVAVDGRDGTVYVVDTANHRITALSPRGEVLRVIGGRGRAPGQLLDPLGVDVGPDGSVYVADAGNFRVQRFAPNGHLLNVWGRRGEADGEFDRRGPVDVAVGPDGSVFVADDGSRRIQRFAADGTFERAWNLWDCNPPRASTETTGTGWRRGWTWAGASRAVPPFELGSNRSRWAPLGPTAPMTSPAYVDIVLATAADGTVYAGTGVIDRYTRDGACLGRFGGGGVGPGRFRTPGPYGMDIAPDGEVFVSDGDWDRVQRFGPEGDYRGMWYVPGANPRDLAFAPDGTLYIAQIGQDAEPGRVLRMTREGHKLEHWGRAAGLPRDADAPHGVAVQTDGTVWVTAGDRVLRYSSDGAFLGAIGMAGDAPGRLAGASGLVVGGTGEMWITEASNHRVQAFDPAGQPVVAWGNPGDGQAQLRAPADLAILDSRWLHRWLVVVEAGNHRLSYFNRTGAWLGDSGAHGSGPEDFDTPTGIASTTDGFWVADSGNHRLVFYDPFDPTRIIGGHGDEPGQLDTPRDLAVGAGGALFVADTGNSRVQVFDAAGQAVRQWGGRGREPGRFDHPESIALAPNGEVYVADTGNRRIQRFDANGTLLSHWSTPGWSRGTLHSQSPSTQAAIDAAGAPDGRIFVANLYEREIQRLGPNGRFEMSWDVVDPAGKLAQPLAVAVAPDGRVFVLASSPALPYRVIVYTADGALLAVWPAIGGSEDEDWARDLAVGPNGEVYLLFNLYNSPRVWRFTADGTRLDGWRLSGGEMGNMSPSAIAIGPDGSVYTLDEYGRTVERFTALGAPLGRWSTGRESPTSGYPAGLTVTPDGTVYVSRLDEATLRVYGPDGQPRGHLATPGGCDGAVEEPESSPQYPAFYRRRLAARPDGSLLVAWGSGCVEAYTTAPRAVETWRIERHANPYLAESPAVVDEAPALDHNWGGAPPDPRLPPRGFSARTEKRFTLDAPRRMDLDVASQGGLRLWVDEVLAIDEWDRAEITRNLALDLPAGQHRILALHHDDNGRATLRIGERLAPPIASPAAASPPSPTLTPIGPPVTSTPIPERRSHIYFPGILKEIP